MAGRPKAKFTEQQIRDIEQMAFNQCQTNTIAKVIGCDNHTLEKHFSQVLTKKRAEGRKELRRTQMEQSAKNPTMSIWLGKQYLEQKDKQDLNVKGQMNVRHYNLSQLKELLKEDESKPEVIAE